MTTIALTTDVLSAALIAAAVDEGLISSPCVLVTVNDAPIPEASFGLAESPGFDQFARRFDGVIDLNATIAPHLPRTLRAGSPQARMVLRRIRHAAGGDVTRLVMAAFDSDFSLAFARLFPSARVDALADRLEAYGPSLRRLERGLEDRVEQVIHCGLLPGVEPRRFVPTGATPVRVNQASVRGVLTTLAGVPTPTDVDEAWIVGQRFAAVGALPPDEARDLAVGLLNEAVSAGYLAVAYKPHPDLSESHTGALSERATTHAVKFRVLRASEPVELAMEATVPRAVIGCSSTALASASALYGIPAFSLGTTEVARTLTQFDDPHRVPLALTRATLPSLDDGRQCPPGVDAQSLLKVLCHEMQPDRYPRANDREQNEVASWDGSSAFLEAPETLASRSSRLRTARVGARRALPSLETSPLARRSRSVRNVLAATWFAIRLRADL